MERQRENGGEKVDRGGKERIVEKWREMGQGKELRRE